MQGGGEQPAGQQREEEVLCGGAHDETGAGACVVPMPDLGGAVTAGCETTSAGIEELRQTASR